MAEAMNEWDVICALATGAVIRADEDCNYELVKPLGPVGSHIVGRLCDRGMVQGFNAYRLSDAGHRYYMQRVDGRAPDRILALAGENTALLDDLRKRGDLPPTSA